jgi:hypothetical protein
MSLIVTALRLAICVLSVPSRAMLGAAGEPVKLRAAVADVRLL